MRCGLALMVIVRPARFAWSMVINIDRGNPVTIQDSNSDTSRRPSGRRQLQAIAEWVRKPKTLELIRRAIDDAEASGDLSVSQAAEKRAEVEEIAAHRV